MRMRTTMLMTALLAVACGSSGGPGTSKVSLLLKKDATSLVVAGNTGAVDPGPFSKAIVTIAEVDLMGSHGKEVLSTQPLEVNLLATDLGSQIGALVSARPVPVGTYSELRLVITGGYVKLADTGAVFASPGYDVPSQDGAIAGTLKMPSFAQSGLKVTMPSDALVIEGDTKILLVEFDVAQSFGHEAGSSASWVMHPVVKGADFTLSGNLTVSVTVGPGVPVPAGALSSFEAVLSTDTNDPHSPAITPLTAPLVAVPGATSYVATFKYVLPGPYLVSFRGTGAYAHATLTTTPAGATVSSQQDVTASFTVSGFVP